MKNRFDISQLTKAVERGLDDSVNQIRIRAEYFYLDTFKKEGFTDKTFKAWAPRKRDRQGRQSRDQRRGLLVQSGDLRRSISVEKRPNNSVEVFVDENISGKSGRVVNYAEVHNKGIGKMPKRQFIGESAMLNRDIVNDIEKIFRRNIK